MNGESGFSGFGRMIVCFLGLLIGPRLCIAQHRFSDTEELLNVELDLLLGHLPGTQKLLREFFVVLR